VCFGNIESETLYVFQNVSEPTLTKTHYFIFFLTLVSICTRRFGSDFDPSVNFFSIISSVNGIHKN
jgi:hypothetical protein